MTDTLDGLLRSLILSPRDAALCAIIADCLEEIAHPAAAWWRIYAVSPAGVVRYHWGWRFGNAHFANISAATEMDPLFPGVADICGRLEAAAAWFAAQPKTATIDATLREVFWPASSRHN